MDFVWRRCNRLVAAFFNVVFTSAAIGFAVFAVSATAAEPAGKVVADYADPRATYRTYLDAVQRNDLAGAKKCWVFDDDPNPGAVDTIVGMTIVPRQFFSIAEKKFAAMLPADFQRRQRDDLTDAAIDLTRQRIADAEVKITGESAELKLKWQKDDGDPNPAFDYRDDPVSFRKVAGGWKIDGNQETGLQRGADFFKAGGWGAAFRDQVELMQDANQRIEQGALATWADTETFFKDGFEVLRKKHEARAAARLLDK